MPIQGLTGESAWPRLGELRKGDEKPKSGKAPGKDLGDTLRFTGKDGTVDDDWTEAFGSTLVQELEVRLPYPTVDQCWQAWREEWVAGGLVRRCDGQNEVLWRLDNGEMESGRRPCSCGDVGTKVCGTAPIGRLEIVVPALARMGTVTVLTTSIHDIQNVDGTLRAIAMAFGDLSRVPLLLKRVPRMISTPSSQGKRARREAWLLHLEAHPSWTRMMLDAGGAAPTHLIETTARHLPSPDVPAPGPAALPDHGPADEMAVEPIERRAERAAERVAKRVSIREALAEIDTWDGLIALWPTVRDLESASHKQNAMRVYYGKAVQLAERDAWALQDIDELQALKERLLKVPADIEGRDGILDALSSKLTKLKAEARVGTEAEAVPLMS